MFPSPPPQLGRLQDAADAAATVLVAQPEHQIMKDNLQQYIDVHGVTPAAIVNRELKVKL